MYFRGLEHAIPAIQRLQPTYAILTATLLPSSRDIEGVRSKVFLAHVMKACAECRSIAPSSRHPYPRYWCDVICQLHAPAAILPWNDPLYPFHSSLGEPIADLGVFIRKKITCLAVFEPLTDCATHCVAVCITYPQVSLLMTLASALPLDMCLANDCGWVACGGGGLSI